MKLKTKRLILWEPIQKDIGDLVEGLNNLNVSRTFGVVPYPYTELNAFKWVSKCIEDSKKEIITSYHFGIELKSEKKLIGEIDLNHIDYFNQGASLSYWVNEKYWNKRISNEAIKPIIDFAFNELKLRRLYLFAYSSNESSNNLAKKLGFELEGTLKQSHKSKATGEIFDANCYGLLNITSE